MTREETVKNLLTELIDMIDNGSQRDLDRADEISKTIIEALSQEPCDDAISREAVYSILKEYHLDEEEINSAMDDCQNLTVNGIASDISLLPSVTPSKEYVRNIHDKEICPYCGKERWSK